MRRPRAAARRPEDQRERGGGGGRNYYRRAYRVGNWGGICTCPDGQRYEVGDENNWCGSLACENGEAGPCSANGIHPSHYGMKVTCGAPLPEEVVLRVKVLSYNLYWWHLFGERDGNHGSAGHMIAQFSKTVPYDFMGLQECNKAERVLADGGLQEEFASLDARGGNSMALCLVYRHTVWSVVDHGLTYVAEDAESEYWGRRAAQWARLRHMRTSRYAFFVNHHGPLPLNTGGRCGGTAVAYHLMRVVREKAKEGDAVIVVGDFNANGFSETVAEMARHLHQIYAGPSYGGVDNIFGNIGPASIVEVRTLGSGGSDHSAIHAVLDIGCPTTNTTIALVATPAVTTATSSPAPTTTASTTTSAVAITTMASATTATSTKTTTSTSASAVATNAARSSNASRASTPASIATLSRPSRPTDLLNFGTSSETDNLQLASGDEVCLKSASTQKYITVVGHAAVALSRSCGDLETFLLENDSGGKAVHTGDIVVLRARRVGPLKVFGGLVVAQGEASGVVFGGQRFLIHSARQQPGQEDQRGAAGGNRYRREPGVGKWGGICTCADGRRYEVGDNHDDCGSLACENGNAGPCSSSGIQLANAGMKVTCAVPDVTPGDPVHSGDLVHFQELVGSTWLQVSERADLLQALPLAQTALQKARFEGMRRQFLIEARHEPARQPEAV